MKHWRIVHDGKTVQCEECAHRIFTINLYRARCINCDTRYLLEPSQLEFIELEEDSHADTV